MYPPIEQFYGAGHQPALKTVTLVQDTPIALNGIKVTYHKRGEVMELPEDLADSMIRSKQAVAGTTKKPPEATLAPAAERVNLMESRLPPVPEREDK
jgi:hypothetical protein